MARSMRWRSLALVASFLLVLGGALWVYAAASGGAWLESSYCGIVALGAGLVLDAARRDDLRGTSALAGLLVAAAGAVAPALPSLARLDIGGDPTPLLMGAGLVVAGVGRRSRAAFAAGLAVAAAGVALYVAADLRAASVWTPGNVAILGGLAALSVHAWGTG